MFSCIEEQVRRDSDLLKKGTLTLYLKKTKSSYNDTKEEDAPLQ